MTVLPIKTSGSSVPRNEPHRLLVLDDEELIIQGLRHVLGREGYEVTCAADAVQACQALAERQFSVVIADQHLPGQTGLEFLARVRAVQPMASRVLMTGILSLDTVVEAINQGEVYRFLVKPWLREELLVTIKNAVQRFELLCCNADLQASTQAANQRLVLANRALEEQLARVAEQNELLGELNQGMEKNLTTSIQLSVRTLEIFCPRLGVQAQRTVEVCRVLSDSLALGREDRRILEVSGWLHDIGLVGVPRRLIQRWDQDAAGLKPEERKLLEHHPVLGQEFAGLAYQFEGAGEVIRAHHERYDGGGYPDGLRAEAIPWLARLLTVAIGAIGQHDRQVAEQRLQQGSGLAYDPAAVQALLRVLSGLPWSRQGRQVALAELKPGMVLARSLHAVNGTLLLAEGQELSAPYLELLLKYHQLRAIDEMLTVYC